MKNLTGAITAIIICEFAGAVGAIFTAPSIATWYAGLAKPQFAPPNWVFAPVWTTLFALMGIAAFLVWNKRLERKDAKAALVIFVIQLALNVLWSSIFFGSHSPGGAFIEIIFLWLAILATIIAFAKISKPAAWLLAPYILWVTFAACLNWLIYILNR
jgi:tryptophan-rich sensory protein